MDNSTLYWDLISEQEHSHYSALGLNYSWHQTPTQKKKYVGLNIWKFIGLCGEYINVKFN